VSLGNTIRKANSCIPSAANYDAKNCPTLTNTLNTAATLHNVAIGTFIGAGVAAVGAVTYIAWPNPKPKPKPPTTGITLDATPVVGLGQGGILISGAF